jgi:ABC-type uncharacterized transport system substrate-binding protein
MPFVNLARRRFLGMLLLGGLVSRAGRAHSAGVGRVVVLMSANEATYWQAADAIKAGLPRAEVQVLALPASLEGLATLPLVTLGQKAAHAAAQGHDGPVLAAMIPRTAYQAVLAELAPEARRRWSALVLDQPWARQFGLIRLLLPKARQVGLLVGTGNADALSDLRAAAAVQGLTIEANQVADERQMFARLRQLLGKVDVLWALPDPTVITRGTLGGYLMSAYRAGIPVIGYSRAMVDAGALAAVYSTPEEIGRNAAEILARAVQEGTVRSSGLHEPRHFSVRLNNGVARSLELNVPDEATLKERLQRGTDS